MMNIRETFFCSKVISNPDLSGEKYISLMVLDFCLEAKAGFTGMTIVIASLISMKQFK